MTTTDTPIGHIRLPDNKLTETQLDAVRRLIASGADPKDIATLLQAEYVELPQVHA